MSYVIPSVSETTPRGERFTDIYSRLLSERIVFLGSPIDDDVANVVIAQLLYLAAADPTPDINLYINSPGGSFTAMMAIYDTMEFIGVDIATFCVGQAASAAAILLAAGTPGKRAILRHARVLLQQPHTSSSRGSMTDLALEAAELQRLRQESDELLATHTNRLAEQVSVDTDRALVLSGIAAVSYGVVDFVAAGSGRHTQVDALHPTTLSTSTLSTGT
jgi:ATP-dependent Clp protease, protease subunit